MTTTSITRVSMISRIFTLACVLSLSACDGGIFGTGSGDDLIIPGEGTPPSNGVSTDASPDDTAESSAPDTDLTDPDDSSSNVSSSVDGTPAAPDELTDLEISNIDPTSSTPETLISESFVNNTPAVSGDNGVISLFNATSINLSAYEATPARQLFGFDGVSPLSLSDSETLSDGINRLAIVDAQDVSATLVTFQSFTVAQSSLTTIVVVQDEQQFDALALVTETSTSDPTLARVRVVDAGVIQPDSPALDLTLLSTGVVPSGIDIDFPTLEVDSMHSEYLDVPTGQYELNDELNLIAPQTLDLEGGMVYTIILTGTAPNEMVIVNDTLMGE